MKLQAPSCFDYLETRAAPLGARQFPHTDSVRNVSSRTPPRRFAAQRYPAHAFRNGDCWRCRVTMQRIGRVGHQRDGHDEVVASADAKHGSARSE